MPQTERVSKYKINLSHIACNLTTSTVITDTKDLTGQLDSLKRLLDIFKVPSAWSTYCNDSTNIPLRWDKGIDNAIRGFDELEKHFRAASPIVEYDDFMLGFEVTILVRYEDFLNRLQEQAEVLYGQVKGSIFAGYESCKNRGITEPFITLFLELRDLGDGRPPLFLRSYTIWAYSPLSEEHAPTDLRSSKIPVVSWSEGLELLETLDRSLTNAIPTIEDFFSVLAHLPTCLDVYEYTHPSLCLANVVRDVDKDMFEIFTELKADLLPGLNALLHGGDNYASVVDGNHLFFLRFYHFDQVERIVNERELEDFTVNKHDVKVNFRRLKQCYLAFYMKDLTKTATDVDEEERLLMRKYRLFCGVSSSQWDRLDDLTVEENSVNNFSVSSHLRRLIEEANSLKDIGRIRSIARRMDRLSTYLVDVSNRRDGQLAQIGDHTNFLLANYCFDKFAPFASLRNGIQNNPGKRLLESNYSHIEKLAESVISPVIQAVVTANENRAAEQVNRALIVLTFVAVLLAFIPLLPGQTITIIMSQGNATIDDHLLLAGGVLALAISLWVWSLISWFQEWRLSGRFKKRIGILEKYVFSNQSK